MEDRPARPPDTEDARATAWSAVHDTLPALWHVGPGTYDPGRRPWSVTAHGPLPGLGKAP